jgi:VWFA-related protein
MQRAVVLSAAFICCILRCAVAQQPSPAGPDGAQKPELENRQLSQSRLIHLDAVVTDKSGNPIVGLTQADFTLFDNGRPSPIANFSAIGKDTHEAAPPVEAVLVFDTINLSFQSTADARAEVATFLRQNGGNLPIPVSAIWLTSGGWMEILPPSLNGNPLAEQIDPAKSRLRTLQAPSSSYDTLDQIRISVQMMKGIGSFEARKPGRKLLLWIGPGWPLFNRPPDDFTNKYQEEFFADITTLSSELRQSRIAVYSLIRGMPGRGTYQYESFLKGVKRWQEALPPYLNLRVLAVQSGGRVMAPSNDLVPELNDCLRDAGPFYSLTFMPPAADGPNEYHELQLRVQKPGLVVHTSSGYYNQP